MEAVSVALQVAVILVPVDEFDGVIVIDDMFGNAVVVKFTLPDAVEPPEFATVTVAV